MPRGERVLLAHLHSFGHGGDYCVDILVEPLISFKGWDWHELKDIGLVMYMSVLEKGPQGCCQDLGVKLGLAGKCGTITMCSYGRE